MKVMTFNILCGDRAGRKVETRHPFVADLIKKESPDSIGVQEATPEWMDYLKEKLDEYAYVGVGRDDGKNDGEYSAVFYKKDKFELLESDNFWLSDTPDVPGKGWDAVCIRICSWALLREKATGKKYVHLNTHLDHIGTEARQKGMEMIFAKAESISAPTVVTGDFNFYEDSDFYKGLVSGKMRDTKHIADVTDSGDTFHGYGVSNDTGVIDFILVSPEFKVKEYKIIRDKYNDDYPSDHFPVKAIIEF